MTGRVILVGAGPGDPDLLTIRALRAIRSAEAVLHDRLVHPGVLAEVPPEAIRIDVGKTPRGRSTAQGEIHRLLIEQARAGRRVIRLHGGDPFVFGRGGEEIAALKAAGIPYEIVPGLSSAFAAPALAALSLTWRGLVDAVAVVTARTEAGRSPDWSWLRGFQGSLVVLMGVAVAGEVADRLLALGFPPTRPAVVIVQASWPSQAVFVTDLAHLGPTVTAREIHAPAVICIGDGFSGGPDLAQGLTSHGGGDGEV